MGLKVEKEEREGAIAEIKNTTIDLLQKDIARIEGMMIMCKKIPNYLSQILMVQFLKKKSETI